jgi:large subunit ribosomal protein L25
MKRISISAQLRNEKGNGPNRRLRQGGQFPAILYGQGVTPVMLSIDNHTFLKATAKLGDAIVMYDIAIEGGNMGVVPTVIRDIMRDPVTERIVHIDLMRVDLTKAIDMVIAVHGHGVPAGIAEGGQLEYGERSLQIRCLPTSVPEHLDVDIAGMKLGATIHAGDLALPEGVELISGAQELLFAVHIPRAVAEEKTEATEAVAAPAAAPAPEKK